ncbi:unnamed protein product [Sphagnum balticum]
MSDEKQTENGPNNGLSPWRTCAYTRARAYTDNAAETVTEETKNLTVADDKDDGKQQENGYDSKPSEGTLSSNEEKSVANRRVRYTKSSRKIFVGGISADTSNEDLLSHFSQFGPVTARKSSTTA